MTSTFIKEIEARILREDQALALIDSLRSFHEQERNELVVTLTTARRLRADDSGVARDNGVVFHKGFASGEMALPSDQQAKPVPVETVKPQDPPRSDVQAKTDPLEGARVGKEQSAPTRAGAKLTSRPAGIPSNKEMFVAILRKAGRPMRAREIVTEIARTYWPDVPESTTADLYRFVPSVLKKDDQFRFSLNDDPAPPIEHRPPPRPEPPSAPPTATIKDVVQKHFVAVPEQDDGHEFEAFGKTIKLPVREWRVANALFEQMDKGVMPSESLVAIAFKGDSKRANVVASIFVADMANTLNRKLEPLKLTVQPYQKVGWFMREVS